MDRVDFYLLGSPKREDQHRLACRLAEKAWQKGHSVFVRAGCAAAVAQLDDLLWTFRADSFVPHAVYSPQEGATLPVLVGMDIAPSGPVGVLINLHASVPVGFEQCTRLAELVGPDEASRDSARKRYRLYRDQGCSLHYHAV